MKAVASLTVTFISFLMLATPAAVFADAAETALTLNLKRSAVASGEFVRLSEIADIELAPGFEGDAGRLGSIIVGYSPRPGMVRTVNDFEIAGAVAKKIRIPEGALKMAGSRSCAVSSPRSLDNSAAAAALLSDITSKARSLYVEKFGEAFGLGGGEKLNFRLVSNLPRAAVRKLLGMDEITVSIPSYRSGVVQVVVAGPEGAVATVYARATLSQEALRAVSAFARDERLDFARLAPYEIEIFPERKKEYITRAVTGTSAAVAGDTGKAPGPNLFASRAVASGEVVTFAHFKKRSDVRAGQKVLLLVAGAKSKLSFDAVARTSGSVGETVEAVNPKTQRKYRARVTGPGCVEAI